jgi:hypothetical protein
MGVATVLAQVTVYASGARVRRVTTVNGAPSHVRLDDLPVSVIDDTVRVEIEGPAIATNVRVALDAARAEDAADEVAPELRAARHDVSVAEADVERLDAALARLAEAPIIEEDPSDDPPAPWIQVALARRAIVAMRAERELALRTKRTAARRILEEAQRALEAAQDRDRRSTSARDAKLHELRKHVDVELQSTGDGDVKLTLEYQVGAARWAPSYVAKLDGDRAVVEVRAVVAQETGEDWTNVPLRLSTAEPERFAELPELAAQRIGRRQHEPAKSGFRAPPVGADALYADFDRGLKRKPPVVTKRAPATEFGTTDELYVGAPPAEPYRGALGGAAGEDWDEGSSRAKGAYPSQMAPMPAAQAIPANEMKKARKAAPGAAPMKTMMFAAGGAAPSDQKVPPPGAPTPRLDYTNLRMASPTSAQRGQLVPAERDHRTIEIEGEVTSAQARLVSLPLPPGCIANWTHAYDYAFATDGAVDVKSDGAWHSIAVTQKSSTAKVRHVSVPREQADVFRMAQIANPFIGPLLPGPIDVYDHGRFLVTSEVDYRPPGASVEIGLGVDPQVKIARNTEFREEATGMLRGALRLHHAITIDVDNLSGRPIDLEVRERVPVVSENEEKVEIALQQVEPSWERWTPETDAPHERRLRGGYRWRMQMPAGQKKKLRASYQVEIANKLELVGGNRRES